MIYRLKMAVGSILRVPRSFESDAENGLEAPVMVILSPSRAPSVYRMAFLPVASLPRVLRRFSVFYVSKTLAKGATGINVTPTTGSTASSCLVSAE